MMKGEFLPVLYGQFNNWQPQPMVKLSYMIEYLNQDDCPDFLEMLKKQNRCRQNIKQTSEMTSGEQERYRELHKDYLEKLCEFENWSRIL